MARDAAPAHLKRRLATILAADVAGYSRLMSEDEEATIRKLADYRGAIDGHIAGHDGRVFHSAGDSVLAEFSSPVEAVRCAAAVQSDIAVRNADVPFDRRMTFRIGIHLGDVVVDGDNLLGDGVNVAARLEGLAEPGGMTISGAVHDHVDGKLDLAFTFDGEKEVKNIARRVPVYRLVREGEEAEEAAKAPTGRAGTTELPSIAVLPFDNMGGDPKHDYFADGISEDLITELSRFRELSVVARNSAFTYKGRAVKVQDVGRELGVRYVLEGSVRKAGKRVRVSAQLIDAETGHHLWAERFDRDVEDLFAVQDEVTQKIVATLAPTLEASERRRARNAERTENLQAYDLALRARELWLRFTAEDNRAARALYEQAVKLDPDYARAYAGLAWTYLLERQEAWTDDAGAALAQAQAYARQAVKVNPSSHSAWLIQGWVQRTSGDLERAAESIQRAIELNPNDSDSYVFLANTEINRGAAEEAIGLVERALKLTGQSPGWHLATYGAALYAARRYEEAAAALRRVEGMPLATRTLAISLGQLGRTAEAQVAVKEYLARYPNFSIARHIADIPYQSPEAREHYAEGLRKAGFPE